MLKLIPVAALGVVFVAIGVADALRPAAGDSPVARSAQARLDAVPMTVGAWAGESVPVPPKHLRIAEAQAHLSRTYTRGRSGPAVSVLVLYGEPGPLGAHTPESCYAGSGFTQLGPAAVHRLARPDTALWLATFETPGVPPQAVRVAWGWGTGAGPWAAATNPRVELAGAGAVYKLYASRAVRPGPAADPDPIDDLLGVFLPAFDAATP